MNIISNKKFLFFIIFCAFVLSLYVSLRIDAPNYEQKLIRHNSIVDNSIDYPYKYRILNPFITNIWITTLELFISEKASFLAGYFIQNLIVFLLLFYSVFKFFSLWFNEIASITSSLLFGFIIPVTLTGYDVLGDMTTAGLMAFGFYLINTQNLIYLYPLVFVGAFNELQIILLVAFYFISKKHSFSDSKVWINAVLLVVTFLLAYMLIYLFRGGSAGSQEWIWYFTKDAAFNIANKDWVILWFILTVPLLIFALKTIGDKPEFLRRSLFIVIPAFYLLVFFFMARLREMDKALTIFLILIPLALISIFPSHSLKDKT